MNTTFQRRFIERFSKSIPTRYSLRSLLLFAIASGLAMSLLAHIRNEALAQRNAIEKLRDLSKGEVYVLRSGQSVDCLTGVSAVVKLRPASPEWTRRIADAFGVDLEVVESVSWNGEEMSDVLLSALCDLQHLEALSITGTRIDPNGLAELRHDQDFTKLARLAGTRLSDSQLERIGGLTTLKKLNLSGIDTKQGGLLHLAGLDSAKTIRLNGVKLNAAELMRLRSGLPRCRIKCN